MKKNLLYLIPIYVNPKEEEKGLGIYMPYYNLFSVLKGTSINRKGPSRDQKH